MNAAQAPTPEHDRRHEPGAGARRWWNESLWFPLYDPERRIGIVFRSGVYPAADAGSANVFLAIVQDGHVVYSLTEQWAPLPAFHPERIEHACGLSIEWKEPLRSFRLRYDHAAHGFDLVWTGSSPPYLYPGSSAAPAETWPRHLEQGGRATGQVRIGGRTIALDAFAHRDHSFGGERDWDRFHRWNYLSGELRGPEGQDFWFNAVRIKFDPESDWIQVGCLWDGSELLEATQKEMRVATADGGTRATGASCTLTDARGRSHHVVSDGLLGVFPVRIWGTWLKDAFVAWSCGEREGYGILEHSYREGSPLSEFL